jgi:hypothetical protein
MSPAEKLSRFWGPFVKLARLLILLVTSAGFEPCPQVLGAKRHKTLLSHDNRFQNLGTIKARAS